MRLYLFLAIGLSLLAGKDTRADTIVLKNGRRIVALSVVVEGDKVRYLTSAGELALPKSIVDHIEKGGQISVSPSAGAANLAITPPSIEPTAANAAAWCATAAFSFAATASDRASLATAARNSRSTPPSCTAPLSAAALAAVGSMLGGVMARFAAPAEGETDI